MTTLIIPKLRELLGPNGENWCQGPPAMDSDGGTVEPEEDTAVKFCLYGGLYRIRHLEEQDIALAGRLLDSLARSMDYAGYIQFNEWTGRTWYEIDRFLDKAAAIERGEAAL